MHLVQDMSVPEHTRNDGHAAYAYEEWVRDSPSSNDAQRQAVWTNALSNPQFIDPAALGQQSAFGIGRAPITNLFDMNHYDGTNPQVTLDHNIGLSEYTNANFVSPDTIFSSTFPNPARANTNAQVVEIQAEDGVTDHPYYVFLNGQNYKLAAYSYFANNQLPFNIPEGWKYNLDDNVYEDYATLLLPRAVGYSAALLNYFFRGQINLAPGGDGRDQYVITNNSSEDMTGTFSLFYDDINDNRIMLAQWENIAAPARGESQVVSFVTPSSPDFPAPKEKHRYILVFQGAMGNETGAVAARVVKLMWREEWNNGLHGNHPWAFSGIDLIDETWLYYNLTSSNISDGKLLMTNAASADPVGPNYNSAFMGQSAPCQLFNTTSWSRPGSLICAPFNFGSEVPIPITRNTWVRVKIDELKIEPPVLVPHPSCHNSFGIGQYQGISISFNNGETVFFSVPGQEKPGHVAYVTEGREYAMNIFDSFRDMGIEFQEPVGINFMEMVQQLFSLCETPEVAHTQRMAVDYIRLEERE
jgi:hypothetical protein